MAFKIKEAVIRYGSSAYPLDTHGIPEVIDTASEIDPHDIYKLLKQRVGFEPGEVKVERTRGFPEFKVPASICVSAYEGAVRIWWYEQ